MTWGTAVARDSGSTPTALGINARDATDPTDHNGQVQGHVVEIQRFAVHDGPGIRTVVFLKGCPLRCVWCQNPEAIDPRAEISHTANRCVSCGACAEVCPRGAIRLAAAGIEIDRSMCARCGTCADECFAGATRRIGREQTVSDVLHEVVRDREFYERSGGGLTLSGGEPFLQHRFAAALLRGAKRLGLHTAVETCGYFRWRNVESALRDVDLLYFDLKIMDDAQHRACTGAGNSLILANARRVATSDTPVVFRCPLVPDRTATSENIAALIEFLGEVGQDTVHLLPYHPLGESKLARIESRLEPLGLDAMAHDVAREIAGRFEAAGLRPVLGGS